MVMSDRNKGISRFAADTLAKDGLLLYEKWFERNFFLLRNFTKQLRSNQEAAQNKEEINTCPAKLTYAAHPFRMREQSAIVIKENHDNSQSP